MLPREIEQLRLTERHVILDLNRRKRRTDLQQITGLSWGTVTNTTRELLGRKFIREQGAISTKAGRKPVQLALNAGGGGILNPMFVVHNHANALPASVLFDGAPLTADVDYFATVDPPNADHADTRLWITVNRNWVGSHTLAVQ